MTKRIADKMLKLSWHSFHVDLPTFTAWLEKSYPEYGGAEASPDRLVLFFVALSKSDIDSIERTWNSMTKSSSGNEVVK